MKPKSVDDKIMTDNMFNKYNQMKYSPFNSKVDIMDRIHGFLLVYDCTIKSTFDSLMVVYNEIKQLIKDKNRQNT